MLKYFRSCCGFLLVVGPRRTNTDKTDDAASTIRHYVAALLPTFSGFFMDRMESETGGCDGYLVELGPI